MEDKEEKAERGEKEDRAGTDEVVLLAVLGQSLLKGGAVPLTLQNRVETAVKHLVSKPRSLVYVSGGDVHSWCCCFYCCCWWYIFATRRRMFNKRHKILLQVMLRGRERARLQL
jgi:hypothetical protein